MKADKKIKQGLPIPQQLAYQCISGYGWYKNTNSYNVRKKNNINHIHNECKQTISRYSKLIGVDNNANSTES